MIRTIFACLCILSMVTTSNSKDEGMFDLEMDQRLGIQGCRKQCDDRKACVDVEYSHRKLACILKLNVSAISRKMTENGTSFCVQRLVRARTGQIIGLCKLYDDLPLKADNIKYDETKPSFTPMRKDYCQVSGKQNNILESLPGNSSLILCSAKIYKIFLRNSLTVCVLQTANLESSIHFLYKADYMSRAIFAFSLIKPRNDNFFTFYYFSFRQICCKNMAMLKFTLRNDTLHVKDGNTNVTLMEETFEGRLRNKVFLLVIMDVERSCDTKCDGNGTCSSEQ